MVEDFGYNFYWDPLTDILMNRFCTRQPLKSKSKSDQVIPLLKNLQWPSFDLRVKAMVLSMAYKTLHGLFFCSISEFFTL